MKKPRHEGGDGQSKEAEVDTSNKVQNADGESPYASRMVWLISQLPHDQRRQIASDFNAAREANPDIGGYGDWLVANHRAHLDAWAGANPEAFAELTARGEPKPPEPEQAPLDQA